MAIENFSVGNPSNTSLPETLPYDAYQESVFGIRIGSLGFLVPVSLFCEVLDKVKVSPLPNVHPWLSGLLNLRGNLLPIFDLHKVLGESSVDQKKRKLFSIDRGEKAVALWIDNLPEIKDRSALCAIDECPALPEILQRHIIQAYGQNGQIWLSVQLDAFFLTLGQHQYSTAETPA